METSFEKWKRVATKMEERKATNWLNQGETLASKPYHWSEFTDPM